MAEIKKEQGEPVEVQDDSTKVLVQAKSIWEQNKKYIVYGGGAIVVILGAWFAYRLFILGPNEEKANEAIWRAEQYFAKDSLKLALNGDGPNAGFEKVAKNYGSTKAGNLAKYYAGICCLKLSDFNKAVTYFKDFSTDSKSTQGKAYMLLADAYSELNKNPEAIEYYEKAAHYFPEDEGFSSESLFRAGLKSEITGKTEDALKYYKEIKEKFPRSEKGTAIDKYIARLGG